jgi:hypothetical protein
MVYKTDLLMDYIHRPVSSTDHDVSETGFVSVLRWKYRSETYPVGSRIGFTPILPPEDGDRASLRNVVIYRGNRMMHIVHKQVSLVQVVPGLN